MKKFVCAVCAVLLYLCTCAFAVLPADAAQPEEKRYGPAMVTYGGIQQETIEERIDYARKEEDEYVNPYKLPHYYSDYTCGVSAAGTSIAFFDRIYDELIPNHSGSFMFGKYFYSAQDAEVNAMYTSLYNLMGANPAGVTIPQYKSGLSAYVSGKGRTASFEQIMNGSGLNVAKYKAALKSDKLLNIFVDGFNVIDLGGYTLHDNYDKVITTTVTGAHVMTAYGYLDVKYYNSANVNFRTDTYLYCNSGFSSATLCLLRLNRDVTIDDCYILQIS